MQRIIDNKKSSELKTARDACTREGLSKSASSVIKSFEFEVDFNDIETEDIMQVLLAEGKIYVYSVPIHWGKPERAWRIGAGANDVFAWNLPEAVDIEPDDFRDVFECWLKDPEYGVKVWCIIKKGMMPQAKLVQRLIERGIWDLTEYELSPNKYEQGATDDNKN